MKVAYTYHGINQKTGGVSRYFFELISHLKQENEIRFISKYCRNLYFNETLSLKKGFLPQLKFKGKWRIENIIQESFLKKELTKNSFDLIHHTGEDPRIFDYLKNTPIVITIHDLIPELFDKDSNRLLNRQKSIEQANAIICVSENTKNDLLRFYPAIDISKVYVVYHGGLPYQENTARKNTEEKYILYVGSRYKYKNFNLFIQSVSDLLKRNNLKLRCSGEKFSTEEEALIKQLGLKEYIENVGYVSNNELNQLYQGAKCFIYPSLYEGFGIPILEAFQNKCPVCLSNTSCFPEIAQQAACYFDPQDKISICQAVEKILEDDELREDLIKKGTDRLHFFSWEKAAKQTLDIYMKTINEFKHS